MSKMTDSVAIRCVFSTSKYSKTRFRPGLCRAAPAEGAYDAPPEPLVDWGGDTPPIPFPLDAFGTSTVSSPQHKFLATPM